MLKCNGKTFMNLQEAVQWLLNNNALFFMCSEDYAADTEISLSALVNPSPVNPKIGSLVLFADGKVSTIIVIDEDTFTVGEIYADLNPGKDVSGFSIDESQHLIVNYLDGTTEDLGPIFSGDVTISGNLSVTGNLNGESDPSVKPVYFHPIVMWSKSSGSLYGNSLSFVILNNSSQQFTVSSLLDFLKSKNITYISPCSGSIYNPDNGRRLIIAWIDVKYTAGEVSGLSMRGHYADDTNGAYLREYEFTRSVIGDQFQLVDTGVNKIN